MNMVSIMTKSLVMGILGWRCFACGGEIQDAAERSDFRKVRVLLKANPALANSQVSAYGWAPLHEAANVGDAAMAKLLFSRRADGNVRDDYNATPLHWAAGFGHAGVAKVLLSHKVDVNARDKGGQTPLHWAADYGRTDVVKLLLRHHADVNAKGKNGKTALQLARASDYKDIVKLLKKRGAKE